MIKVIIYKHDNLTVGFKLNGHADYDYSGRDIVCSAVSILVLNTYNSIESLTIDKKQFTTNIDKKNKGNLSFILNSKNYQCSEKTRVLLDSLELGLCGIENEYSDYLSITFKEV